MKRRLSRIGLIGFAFAGLLLGVLAVLFRLTSSQQHVVQIEATSGATNRNDLGRTLASGAALNPEASAGPKLTNRLDPRRQVIGDLPPLDPTAERKLIRRYRSLPSLAEKQHILHQLAHRGGPASVDLFINALTREFVNHRFSADDEVAMQALPEVMGLLARRYRQAFDFLRHASEPTFWQGLLHWTSKSGYAPETLMAGAALQGLALTGSDEAWQILESWRTRTNEVVQWDLASGILDAVCNFHRVRQYGIETTMQQQLMGPWSLVSFDAWAETREGKDWEAWARACAQLRRQQQSK